jgi:hypothetical protein
MGHVGGKAWYSYTEPHAEVDAIEHHTSLGEALNFLQTYDKTQQTTNNCMDGWLQHKKEGKF